MGSEAKPQQQAPNPKKALSNHVQFSGHSSFLKTVSNEGPSRSEAAAAPPINNNLSLSRVAQTL